MDEPAPAAPANVGPSSYCCCGSFPSAEVEPSVLTDGPGRCLDLWGGKTSPGKDADHVSRGDGSDRRPVAPPELEEVSHGRARCERRAAGEVERDLNVEYLNIDTRVAKWEEICFHEKDDEKDWRWPFSLDWSWLIRGDRVLHDERFVGLTPRDKRRTEQRLASERSTPKTTPRRGSVSSTPRSQVSV